MAWSQRLWCAFLALACERAPVTGASSAPVSAAPAPTEVKQAPPAAPHASESLPGAPSAAAEAARVGPAGAEMTNGIVDVKREAAPAVLHAVRAAKNAGFDRVVFEFRERVPGYHLEYIDKPVRDCGAGDVKPIEGDGWLEARFYPAYAHTEAGEPTVRQRELKPALGIVREVERTCDFEAVVTWVIGTASPNRYRAFELLEPPRLVVDIEH